MLTIIKVLLMKVSNAGYIGIGVQVQNFFPYCITQFPRSGCLSLLETRSLSSRQTTVSSWFQCRQMSIAQRHRRRLFIGRFFGQSAPNIRQHRLCTRQAGRVLQTVGEVVGGAVQLSPLSVQIRQIVERGCVTRVHVESTLQQLFNFRLVLGHCGEVVPGDDVRWPQSDGFLFFARGRGWSEIYGIWRIQISFVRKLFARRSRI